MKVFQTVQSNYELIGISSVESLHNFPYNPQISIGFLTFGVSTGSYIIYFFNMADDFKAYIEYTITVSAFLIISVCFGAVVLRMTELFENIDGMENVIEMRKFFNPIEIFKAENIITTIFRI